MRDHFAPHPSRSFEGYYTRSQLEDGSTLTLIFCWVRRTKTRGNYVLVSYTPIVRDTPKPKPDGQPSYATRDRSAFMHEFFPERIEISCRKVPRGHYASFAITALGIGSMQVTPTTIEYDICVPAQRLRVHLTLDAHTPWTCAQPLRGPMGVLLHLERLLPLNWHVRSTKSRATYAIEHAGMRLYGTGLAHAEKNWGGSFPCGWIWAQAFSDDGRRTLCLAGGPALSGVQAYLVAYRSPQYSWDFGPPFAIGLGWLSPCMRVRRDSRRGEVEIHVKTWSRRLCVKTEAVPESFIAMAAPMKGGMEPGLAHESFQAKFIVKLSRRKWPLGGWRDVEESVIGETVVGMSCGALEFGGSFWHKEPVNDKTI